MDCRNIDRNEVAEKYLNGQLDEANQDDFEAHILECEKCLQAVEVLQTVRLDLIERAPAIRAQSAVPKQAWFRWQWAAAACSLLIVVGVGLQMNRERLTSQPTAATHKPDSSQDSPMTAERVAKSQPPIPNLPENGRNYATETLDKSPPGRDNAPVVASGSKSGLSLKGNRIPGMNPQEGTTSSKTSDENQTVAANSDETKTPAESGSENSAIATNAASSNLPVGDEISQLAIVRPLPYTFSGVAGSQAGRGVSIRRGNNPPASSVSGGTSPGVHPGAGGFTTAQDFFQDGITAYVEGRYESAANLLGQAVELDPQLADANLYLGICNLLQGKTTDAVRRLQSASQGKKPAVAQAAHFYLAKAYVQQGKLEEADTELRAAAALPGRLKAEANAMIPRLQAVQAAQIKK